MRPALVLACVGALACVSERDLGSHALAGGPTKPDGAPDRGSASGDGGSGDGGSVREGGGVEPRGDSGHDGKIFFVSEGFVAGDLGGLAGADQTCTAEARAAKLGGNYRAWLSTIMVNAKDRISGTGPWRMTNGKVVFRSAPNGDLLDNFPSVTAKGEDLFGISNNRVWTGTNRQLTVTKNGDTCADWTSGSSSTRGSIGQLISIGGEWTDYRDIDKNPEARPCTERLRLYCFEE